MIPRVHIPLLAVTLAALATPCAHAQGVVAVAKLDKRALTGSWYEIARLPNKRQKHCSADAIELIALGDKPTQLQLVDACTDVKYFKDQWNFTATNKNPSTGAWKVRTIFPFSRKYWVLAVGPLIPIAAPPTIPKPEAPPVVANPASDSTTSTQPDASSGAMPAPTQANGAPMANVAPPPPPPPTGYAYTLIGSPNHKQLWIYARTATLDPTSLNQIKTQASAMGFNPAKLVATAQSK